jgi:hypothetical protein
VGVFWDLENVNIPKGADAQDVVARIFEDVRNKYGFVETFCAFADPAQVKSDIRLAFQTHSVRLVDCVRTGNNKKDVVDKFMMAEMANFAMANHGNHAVVCVISGDGDYCIMLSILKRWRHRIVVILPDEAQTNSRLRSVADSMHRFKEVAFPDQVYVDHSMHYFHLNLVEDPASDALPDGETLEGGRSSLSQEGAHLHLIDLLQAVESLSPMSKLSDDYVYLSALGQVTGKFPALQGKGVIASLVDDAVTMGYLEQSGERTGKWMVRRTTKSLTSPGAKVSAKGRGAEF